LLERFLSVHSSDAWHPLIQRLLPTAVSTVALLLQGWNAMERRQAYSSAIANSLPWVNCDAAI
jgi:hypothetical protein